MRHAATHPHDLSSRVVVAPGGETNGLVSMISELVRQNLRDHPRKHADFARALGRVAIVAEDAEVALTLEFEAGQLTLHDGIVGIPNLTLRASGEDILNLSLIEPGRLGLPKLGDRAARSVVKALREGRVCVYGALSNLPLLARLSRLLAVK